MEVGLSVALSESCRPAGLDRITLVAQGHYPADDGHFIQLPLDQGVQRAPGLPLATLSYRLDAVGDGFEGAGLAPALPDVAQRVLVLPMSKSCRALASDEALAGRLVAAFGASELLIAGGAPGDGGSPAGEVRADAWRADLPEGELVGVADGLFVPRTGATALALGTDVIVAGGIQLLQAGAAALASFERFDTLEGTFVELGRLQDARTGHGGVRAADGSLWIAGGTDAFDGKALDTIERIVEGADSSKRLPVRLEVASSAPRLHAFEDGRVLVLPFDHSPVHPAIIDATGSRLDTLEPLTVETTPDRAVVAPGHRLLVFEVADGETTGKLCVRRDSGADVCVDDWLTRFDGLRDARALTLRDGRVLLTGREGMRPTARIVDVGRRLVESRTLEALPLSLHLLGDGSGALLSEGAVHVLREDVLGEVASLPSTLLAPDARPLALDLYAHWRWQGLELEALVGGARADLAAVRFEDFDLSVQVEGEIEILLGARGQAERAVRFEDSSVGPALCPLSIEPGATVHLRRREETLILSTDRVERTCLLDGLHGPVRVALRAPAPGARVLSLSLQRR